MGQEESKLASQVVVAIDNEDVQSLCILMEANKNSLNKYCVRTFGLSSSLFSTQKSLDSKS